MQHTQQRITSRPPLPLLLLLLLQENKTLTTELSEGAPTVKLSDELAAPGGGRGSSLSKKTLGLPGPPPAPVRPERPGPGGTLTSPLPQGLLWQQPGLVWLKEASFRWENEEGQQEQEEYHEAVSLKKVQ